FLVEGKADQARCGRGAARRIGVAGRTVGFEKALAASGLLFGIDTVENGRLAGRLIAGLGLRGDIGLPDLARFEWGALLGRRAMECKSRRACKPSRSGGNGRGPACRGQAPGSPHMLFLYYHGNRSSLLATDGRSTRFPSRVAIGQYPRCDRSPK